MSWLSKQLGSAKKLVTHPADWAQNAGKTLGQGMELASKAAGVIPGVGTLAGAALGAGGSILQGHNMESTVKAGAQGALGGLGGGLLNTVAKGVGGVAINKLMPGQPRGVSTAPAGVTGTAATTAPTTPGMAVPFNGLKPLSSLTPAPVSPFATPTASPTTATATPAPPSASPSAFGPGQNDLRFQTFKPTASALTQQANTSMGQAASALQGAGTGPSFQAVGAPSSFSAAGDTAAARTALGASLGALGTAPNRAQLAQDAFSQMRDSTEPQFQKDLQAVGRKNAALGRVGSGMTTSDFGDVMSNRERDLAAAQRGLATDAAGQEMSDRLNTVSATGAVQNQLFGQDATQANLDQGLRNEGRSENDRGLQFATGENSLLAGRMGAFQGLGRDSFNVDQANDAAMRGERDYQYGVGRDAQSDSVAQTQMQETMYGNEFQRWLQQQQLYGNLGFGSTTA